MTHDVMVRRIEVDGELLLELSPDEISGDGPTEEMSGPAAYEMRARMRMAQRGLDGDEYP